ncbi:hypothetical protein ISF05_30935 [Pseudomonas aeruginosa]|uniref:hypothetical protein n=1 Tax=Pseudomonas aeruginosa TaxID=287 RepID=UPI0024C04FE7|nr:hypothetical protein [Pseudomonas aeruginosa]MBX6589585.1 hypothetical protein [Pseudomonas aeruginosa]MBX6589596.1 hypothetical protein [Pseudomonas aeruginosa]WHV22480.1 hypothetical protein M2I84_15665 [Pseudomonas aeruginosa]WHV73934.1 hypothetical protein M2I95_15675 [Pseudomonas aeruginosa]WHV73942.1 hypothetical protein M2I95_15730 [Pseudomonas aeruginosa]
MIDPADKQTQPLPLEQPKRGRGRPATGKALSDAERARRYRANKKKRDEQPSQKKPDNADLLKQLAQAQARIAELETELASRITEKEEPEAKTWAIQERKGKARWQTISKGLTRKAGERQFDKLLSGLNDPRYSYRMVEE